MCSGKFSPMPIEKSMIVIAFLFATTVAYGYSPGSGKEDFEGAFPSTYWFIDDIDSSSGKEEIQSF